jgi:DNA-binding CsgD family transcriptional regulator
MILTGHALELGSGDPARILFFSRFTYPFIAFCPVFWFLFSLELSLGQKKFMWRPFLFLPLLPIATTCIVWTNPVHRLLWREWTYRQAGEFLVLVVRRYGNWFWVHFAYSYALYLVGIALIVRAFFRQHRLYRIQAYWVLAGGILPLLSNLAYVLRLFGPETKDFTPLVVAMSGALFTVGIRKCALAAISPLPRDEVYLRLEFPVVVLDAEKRIVDFNDAASRNLVTEASLGKGLDTVLGGVEENFPSRATLLAGHAAVSWQEGGARIRGEARVQFLLAEKGKPGGYCVTFFARKGDGEALPPLSRREREILTLVVLDLTNKEIAERLFITESTVKSHIHRLLKKAGVDKREALRSLATEAVSSGTGTVGA